MSPTPHQLLRKRLAVVVTNNCNLACGGCNQLCGHFSDDQLWYRTPEDFERDLQVAAAWADACWGLDGFPEVNRVIAVYGGEPTTHPQWSQLEDIMRGMSDYPFLVYTNGRGRDVKAVKTCEVTCSAKRPVIGEMPTTWAGDREGFGRRIRDRFNVTCECGGTQLVFLGLGATLQAGYRQDNDQLGHVIYRCAACSRYVSAGITPREVFRSEQVGNIEYMISSKDAHSLRSFAPTLVAPVDVEADRGRAAYWKLAQEKCYIWQDCETAVYRGKAYFCIVAAALDHMYNGGQNGWATTAESNPMQRTAEAIAAQAEQFCYRCGFCFGDRYRIEEAVGAKQLTCGRTQCSPHNAAGLSSELVELVLPGG